MRKNLVFSRCVVLLVVFVFIGGNCFGGRLAWYITPAVSYGITPSYNISSAGGKKIGIMYRGGVNIAGRVNEHVSLGTGFSISHYEYYMSYNKGGQVINRQEQSYTEIPLYITWTQLEKKKKGISPCLFVTAGIMVTHMTNAVYHETNTLTGTYAEGGDMGDFCENPAKALLHVGASQRLWQRGDIVLGMEFTSLFRDNVADRTSVVRFLPGSLATAAVKLGFNIWLSPR